MTLTWRFSYLSNINIRRHTYTLSARADQEVLYKKKQNKVVSLAIKWKYDIISPELANKIIKKAKVVELVLQSLFMNSIIL